MRLGIFSILIFSVGCTTNQRHLNVPNERATASRRDAGVILKSAKNTDDKDSSRWATDGAVILFNGQIVKGECDRFRSHLKNDTNTLKVNSSGGDAFEGLCIAREMNRRRFVRTVVSGICVSSCANYLFLGSKLHQIEFGIVGYHGNITALLKRDPLNEALRRELQLAKVDSKEIDRIATDFTDQQRKNSTLEQKFFRDIGVSQELFERTQEPDKGAGDGKDYTFLLPSRQTFSKYGISNFLGEQDFDLGQAMGMNNLLQ